MLAVPKTKFACSQFSVQAFSPLAAEGGRAGLRGPEEPKGVRGSDSDPGRFRVPDSSHSSPPTPIFLKAQAIVRSIWMPVLGSQSTSSPRRCLLASS